MIKCKRIDPWIEDFALLLKADADVALKLSWRPYYGGDAGGPTAIKQAGKDRQVEPSPRESAERSSVLPADDRKLRAVAMRLLSA